MNIYKVQQGDTLEVILKELGITKRVEDITTLPNNKALFHIREPHLLRKGDELYLPDRENIDSKQVTSETDAKHRFTLVRDVRRFVVTITDWQGASLANKDIRLIGDNWERQAQTNGDGLFECEIPISARNARIEVDNELVEIRIGGLDPIHTITGFQARLASLGFRLGMFDGAVGIKTTASIYRFQAEHDLEVDGIVGPKTRRKLLEVYKL
jgi:N-acetylmuramoyl-L-alanine amidase